jgi:sugar phosphate isomerase/epimerase
MHFDFLEPTRMALLSMNELTTFRWSLGEDVEAYRSAGFEGIGVWRDKVSDLGEDQAVELIAKSGLRVSSLSWAGGFTGTDGRSFADAVEDGLDAVRLAARLAAGCLIVHSGARGNHTSNHARRLFKTALQKLLEPAESLGVTLAVEPMFGSCSTCWTFLEGLEESLELIRSLSSPHLKLVFDTYFLAHDEANLAQLTEIVPQLALVQLGDAHHAPRLEQARARLSEGVLPLDSILSSLHIAGYDGFFEVELIGEEIEACDNHALLAHSRQAFDELAQGARAS